MCITRIIAHAHEKSRVFDTTVPKFAKIHCVSKQEFARWLREEMDKRGIKPSQLAVYLEVNHVSVGNWLTAKYRPEANNVIKLAEYFKVDSDWLLELANYRQKKPRSLTSMDRIIPSLRWAIEHPELFAELESEDQQLAWDYILMLRERRRRMRERRA